MIPLHSPLYDRSDIRAINKIIKSNWTGIGQEIGSVEAEWANKYNRPASQFALTNSGTEAIFQVFAHLAKKLKSKKVILPSLVYSGIPNAIVYYGAYPYFIDINGKDHAMPDCKEYIKAIDSDTKAIVLMSYGGQQYDNDFQELLNICAKKRIIVIEDAAGCMNSSIVGTYGDFGIWSFDSLKTITGFDGGMIYCRDSNDMASISASMKLGVIGYSSAHEKMRKEGKEWWIFSPSSPGRRSVSNNVSAALIKSQLKKLNKFCNIQKHFHDFYNIELYGYSAFSKINLWDNPDYFLYVIDCGNKQKQVAQKLLENGIYSTMKYYPVHLYEMYLNYMRKLPQTEKFARTHLNIPIHKNLKIEEAEKIVTIVKQLTNN